MSKILFSILTPSVPERLAKLAALTTRLNLHIGDKPVEHLVLMDNRKRTIGEKRDALLRAARGDYVAFVDDDDAVSDDYVSSILNVIHGGPHASGPDVITFHQRATVNGAEGEIHFGLGNPNEEFKPGDVTKRNAWHVCAWRRALAILSNFPPVNYGEDWQFASKLCSLAGLTSVHIPRVLHHYIYSDETTLAK